MRGTQRGRGRGREGEGEGGICTLVYLPLLTSMPSRAEARRAFLSGFHNTSYHTSLLDHHMPLYIYRLHLPV